MLPVTPVVSFLLTPSNVLILLGLAGLALAVRRPRPGLATAAVGLLGLLAGGLSPLPALAIRPLEDRFPAFRDDGASIAGIVVLGGAIDAGLSQARGQVVVNDAGERAIYLGDLARRFPTARLVYSGGGRATRTKEPAEADIVSDHTDALGLPRARLILENRSRTTQENASDTAALVQPKPGERWLLVTSAWHMPRTVGAFRKAGFTVAPYPVDYRTRGRQDFARFGGLASEGLFVLDLAVKEWIGLAAYRLSGYSDTWFPGPEQGASQGARARPEPTLRAAVLP